MTRTMRLAIAVVAIVALAAANLAIQYRYVADVRATPASRLMLDALAALAREPVSSAALVDMPGGGYAEIVALHTRGRPTYDMAGPESTYASGVATLATTGAPRGQSDIAALARRTVAAYRRERFQLGGEPGRYDSFLQPVLPPRVSLEHSFLLTSARDHSVLNGSSSRPSVGRLYARRRDAVRNHLVPVDSELGRAIRPAVVDDIALWQREPDFAASGTGMQGVGRHVLVEVVNPVPGSRLLIDLTTSPLAGQGATLPHDAAAIGAETAGFGIVGSGAARVVSAPLAPQVIGGRSYLAIDMRAEPRRFRVERRGVLGLYNRDLGFDPRALVGFLRNLSYVTEEEYRAIRPPPSVDGFPAGLFQPGLLFSGVHEDGWIAESARFRLGLGSPSRAVQISGTAPRFTQHGASIDVLVDGEPVLRRSLERGDFDVRVAIPAASGPRWVELRVDPVESIPGPDGRSVSILLRSVRLLDQP